MARRQVAETREAVAREAPGGDKAEGKHKGVWGTVRSIAPAILVALAIRSFLFEPFSIPSGSMLPTLQIGDYVIVTKYAYGIRLPLTNDMIWQRKAPERGDVIVFDHPEKPGEDLIKRVAGLPGDEIELKHGVVYVNGVVQPRTLLSESFAFEDRDEATGHWHEKHGALYDETMLGKSGSAHEHYAMQTSPYPPDDGPYHVPPDSVMVLGDNRDNSADSRVGGWFVPFGNIRGRADVIGFSVGNGHLRTDRLLRAIDTGVTGKK